MKIIESTPNRRSIALKNVILIMSIVLLFASAAFSAEISDIGTLESYIAYDTNAIAELSKGEPPKRFRVIIIDKPTLEKLRNHHFVPGTQIAVNYNDVTGVVDTFEITGK